MRHVNCPAHMATVALMIERGMKVRTWCTHCQAPFRQVDLGEVARVKGPDYSLWGRWTRCKLTPGCQGRNRFFHDGRGHFTGMWD